MERVSLKNMPKEIKISILKQLGYSSDGMYVLDEEGNKLRDKYVGIEIQISNMLILPGSTIILDNNPISVAAYLEEYRDDI